jgi:serine/threonine-protein kinase
MVGACGSVAPKQPGGDDDAGTSDGRRTGPLGTGPYFETAMFFNRDVTGIAKSSKSDSIIAALRAAGGWGNGDKMQIDFSIDVLTADASTPHQSFTPTGDFYTPDCDHVDIPVPVGGNVEGETGYACTGDGDCHLLVYDSSASKLYEMWRANITSTFQGGCLAVWDTKMTYTDTLRGDQCTSADAAGYPMSPLLFTADEVKAGKIDHAIRFILPNDRVQRGYTRPATHGTATTGGTDAPAYGVHLRLRPDFPIDSLPTAGAKVVAQAMQKYGMYHADGGNIALTAQTDRWTTAKWAGLLNARDLQTLRVEDFEVIDEGPMITLTNNCTR